MASFYNASGATGANSGGPGMYNTGGGSGFYGQHQQQQQQQQQNFSNSNMSQWQAPSSTQQSQNGQSTMYGQGMQHQQHQSGQPSFFAGVQQQGTQVATQIAADLVTGNLNAEKIGEKLVDFGKAGFGGNILYIESIMVSLRTYFAVDNRYVKRKMIKVLFPFLNKQWQRSQTDGPDNTKYAPPVSDENAPDLYLPVMSLVTYCLLCALNYGTAGEFNPEVIASVLKWCLAAQLLEVGIMWACCKYTLNAPLAVLDLTAYTGYKYLGLTVNLLMGIMFGFVKNWGRTGFYLTFVWTASAAVFFMLKTLSNSIPRHTASPSNTRDMMVLGFAVSQLVTMWIMSQTKFL